MTATYCVTLWMWFMGTVASSRSRTLSMVNKSFVLLQRRLTSTTCVSSLTNSVDWLSADKEFSTTLFLSITANKTSKLAIVQYWTVRRYDVSVSPKQFRHNSADLPPSVTKEIYHVFGAAKWLASDGGVVWRRSSVEWTNLLVHWQEQLLYEDWR